MLKYLTAGLVAASLLAAPVLVTAAEAAQPAAKTTLTTKPVAGKVVKHKRYAHISRKHVKHARHVRHTGKHYAHARHWKWVKVHGKFVRIFVKKPATVIVRKRATVIIKKPVALKLAPAAKITIAK